MAHSARAQNVQFKLQLAAGQFVQWDLIFRSVPACLCNADFSEGRVRHDGGSAKSGSLS